MTSYDPYTNGWYLLPVSAPKIATPLWTQSTLWDLNTSAWTPSTSKLVSGIDLHSTQVSVLNAHTLQALIELVYVRVGNDVLYQGLNGLDKAISETTKTLDALADLQYFHNALSVSGLGNFSSWFDFTASAYGIPNKNGQTDTFINTYEAAYNAAASAFFGIPIVPDFLFKQVSDPGGGLTIPIVTIGGRPTTYESYASNLAITRNNISQRVDALSALAIGNTAILNDPNSLLNATRAVLKDLPPEQTAGPYKIAWTDAKLWVLDAQTVDDGQDLGQVNPSQVIITYEGASQPKYFADMSLNGIGVGDGWIVGGSSMRGTIGSVRAVGAGTILITYSGRMAIAASEYGAGYAINPRDDKNNVVNPLQDGTLLNDGSYYLGTFNARNDASKSGQIQQNITLAITAAQGLNDTQTTQVKSFMFTFEEYYKSAAALLSKISQIIEKFAQGIRPA